jgi:hypothetical protein
MSVILGILGCGHFVKLRFLKLINRSCRVLGCATDRLDFQDNQLMGGIFGVLGCGNTRGLISSINLQVYGEFVLFLRESIFGQSM